MIKLIQEITLEAREDRVWQPSPGISFVFNDWDRDVWIFTYWPLFPFVFLFYWWSTKRWIVERWMRHRIADVPEGWHCKHWTLRPLSRWTWHCSRTKFNSTALVNAIAIQEQANRDAMIEAVKHYIHDQPDA